MSHVVTVFSLEVSPHVTGSLERSPWPRGRYFGDVAHLAVSCAMKFTLSVRSSGAGEPRRWPDRQISFGTPRAPAGHFEAKD